MDLNKIYENILLLEKTISINDSYWDNYFDEFYEEWLDENGDALSSFFEYPEDFYYWKESLRDYVNESDKNFEEFNNWFLNNYEDLYEDSDIDSMEDEQIAEFQQFSLGFEQFIEKTYLKQQFKENGIRDIDYYTVLYNLRDLVTEDGKIRIFRAMKVPTNYVSHLLKQGKHIGIYWSWDEDTVDTYWGSEEYKDRPTPDTLTLYSEVSEQYVDWKTTLLMNCNLNLSEEREIRLFGGTPLKIKMIVDKNDESISLPDEIKNKIFYA